MDGNLDGTVILVPSNFHHSITVHSLTVLRASLSVHFFNGWIIKGNGRMVNIRQTQTVIYCILLLNYLLSFFVHLRITKKGKNSPHYCLYLFHVYIIVL
jgi:hypothetical protein